MHFPTFSWSASRLQLLCLTSIWISLLPNLASLQRFWTAPSSGSGFQTIAFVFGGWLTVCFVTFTLLFVLSALFWGRSIKLLLIVAIISAAILGYFSLFLGTQFDRNMLLNLAQTHTSEAFELVNLRMAMWVVAVGLVPAVAVWLVPLKTEALTLRSIAQPWGVWLGLAIVLLGTVLLQYSRYASAARNRDITFHTVAPTNIVASTVSYWYSERQRDVVRDPRGTDAKQRYPIAKPRLVVFVLGETARAQNFGMNGYERDTTPRMRDAGVLYFKDTISCGTATAISLPCLFSGLNHDHFSLSGARAIETLIDVMLHSKARVIWRDNDGGCKGVCDRADVVDFTAGEHPRWCPEKGECFDEILLDGLEPKLRAEARDTFLVLHLKGSHGPAYYKRYPPQFEKFAPTCKSSDLSSCEQQHLINAYDNTIFYTDHVLGETVNLLTKLSDQFAASMLYVSDHGESLGENGMYLHGLPYAVAPKEQTRVPMLAWISPQFSSMERWDTACLAAQTKRQVSHDYVYSTLLGFMEIETKEYRESLDLFDVCDTPHASTATRK
jgi:lipid A ethanolaminephosphotransferase